MAFHDDLQEKIDEYVHLVYKLTKQFPKEELYGATSQTRRAALSVALNYVEGYARKKVLVRKNFFETAYGSLKESLYLLDFATEEGWLSETPEVIRALKLGDGIGAMLWSTIEKLSDS